MDKLLASIIFVFIVVNAYPQSSTNADTAHIDSLLESSYQSYAHMDINTSLSHALEALALSEEMNYPKGIARGNFYVGQVLSNLGEFGKALEYLSTAESQPGIKDDHILCSEINRVKGRAYGSLKLYNLATTEFKKGLDIINQINITFEREYLTSLAYDNLAHTYFLQDMSDSALYYLEQNDQLLKHTTEERLFRSRINLHAQFGKAYTKQENYETANFHFTQALQLSEEYNYPYTSWIYLHWGHMLMQQELTDSALVKYRLGLENLRVTNLKSELPGIYTALRDAYIKKGESDSALVYINKKTELEDELNTANMNSLDKAIELLISQEKNSTKSRLVKARSIIVGTTIILGIIAFGIWLRWRKRFQSAVEKEEELKRVIKSKRRSALDEVIELARVNDHSFLPRFMELFPNFTKNFHTRHPNLPKSSFIFCAYIFLHFSSKEIAECLFIEHKSVQTRKNRLRKQLDLPPNTDLYQYMLWLDKPEDSLTANLAGDVLINSGN